jgi:polynucleotide 5'-kinase involved in rRNA processing
MRATFLILLILLYLISVYISQLPVHFHYESRNVNILQAYYSLKPKSVEERKLIRKTSWERF